MSKNTDSRPQAEIAFFNRKTPLGDQVSGSVSFIGIDGYYYAVCEGKLYIHCANVGAIVYAVSHGCQCFLSEDHVFLLAADAIDLTNKQDPNLGAETAAKLADIANRLNATI